MRFQPHLVLVLSVGFGASAGGCGGAAASSADAGDAPTECTPAAALQTVTSTAGTYSVSACASATPARGDNAFALLVADPKGAPVSGLSVDVQTWMPDMGHGGPTTPTVTALGNGVYQVTNCVFTMGGVWQLRTTLAEPTEDGSSDAAIVQFTID